MGISGRVAQSPEWRLLVRDKQAARQSVERLLAWDFDRLVPAHGEVVPTGAVTLLEQATTWMRRA
jgi:glyoxylase-like metal-dependent hydrolase (beta-lactamase superfamily II)